MEDAFKDLPPSVFAKYAMGEHACNPIDQALCILGCTLQPFMSAVICITVTSAVWLNQALSFVYADPQRFYGSSSGRPGDHIIRLIQALRAGDEDAEATLFEYRRKGASSFTSLTHRCGPQIQPWVHFHRSCAFALASVKARPVTRAGGLATAAKYRAEGIPNPGLVKGAPVVSRCQTLPVYMHAARCAVYPVMFLALPVNNEWSSQLCMTPESMLGTKCPASCALQPT